MDIDAPDLREQLQHALGTTYDFERELGGGGMSRVFVASERRFQRQVVVKVLAPELAAGVSAERFAREVGLAARLQQANIVPVLDAGDAAGLPYYTMPWVEGEALRARLDARGALSIAEAIAVIGDVAKALSYAHAHGVVHRDIKPENVLLSGHTAVVTDFGIAKALHASRAIAPFETLTQVGTSLGTPAYMAPEQAMGDPTTDHRADLYALGVVGYELLAGRRPFAGASLSELVRAHVTQAPPPLTRVRTDVPPALATLVMQCLAKDPADRPQSADEVLQAIERLHARSDSASPLARIPMGARRRALVGAVGAVAALLMLFWWKGTRTSTALLNPSRVLVVAPTTDDASLRPLARRLQEATTRALGELPLVHLTDTSIDESSAGETEVAAMRRARSMLSGTVVAAHLYAQGSDSARVEFRVLDAATGELIGALHTISLTRTPDDSAWRRALDPLLSTVAITVFPSLGARAVPLGDPPRFAAVREMLTAMTLEAPDSASYASQLVHMDRAVTLDSGFLQSRLWRAAIRARTQPKAYFPDTKLLLDATLSDMEPMRERFSPFEGALFDFVSAMSRGDQGAVLASLRRMQLIAPDAFLARTLPDVLLDLNRPREALRMVEQQGPIRAPDGTLMLPAANFVRWMRLADIHHYLGEHRAERDATREMRRLLPDNLQSIRYQLTAAAALGDSAEIEELLTTARGLPTVPQTYNFFGDLVMQTSQEALAHGHRAVGDDLLRRTLQWFETRRPEARSWRVQFRHALAYHNMHDEPRALAVLQPLLERDSAQVLYTGLRGRIAAAAGDTAGARRVDAQLAAMGAGMSGGNTVERAFIAALLGQRADAVGLLQEAFAQGTGFTLRRRLHWFNDLVNLRGYAPFARLLEPQG